MYGREWARERRKRPSILALAPRRDHYGFLAGAVGIWLARGVPSLIGGRQAAGV